MDNKKTFVLGIIIIIGLAGMFYYYNNRRNQQMANQAASIIQSGTPEEKADLKENLNISETEFVMGDPEAPVTIIEYSSHFCGHCVNFHATNLPLLKDNYIKTGKVKLVTRLVSPLELGTAVLCGQEQGKFSEMNDYLFENASEIESIDGLKEAAGKAGLDQKSFDECYDSKKYEERAQKWFDQAREANIEGTPTFFINEQRIDGNQPYSEFVRIIEEELAK
jgi:protein-disulfide isomerase